MWKKIIFFIFLVISLNTKNIGKMESEILNNSYLSKDEKEELKIIFDITKEKCGKEKVKRTQKKEIKIVSPDKSVLIGNIDINTLKPIETWNLYKTYDNKSTKGISFCIHDNGYISRYIENGKELHIKAKKNAFIIIYDKNRLYKKILNKQGDDYYIIEYIQNKKQNEYYIIRNKNKTIYFSQNMFSEEYKNFSKIEKVLFLLSYELDFGDKLLIPPFNLILNIPEEELKTKTEFKKNLLYFY